MRLSTDLLARFLQATGRQAGREALQAQDLTLPPSITPVLVATGPIARFTGFSASVVQRETSLSQVGATVPASTGAAVVDIITLGRGSWQIIAQLDSISDYSGAPAAQTCELLLTDPTAATLTLIAFMAAANVPQHATLNFPLVLGEDGWKFQLSSRATAVAQTRRDSATLIASRTL